MGSLSSDQSFRWQLYEQQENKHLLFVRQLKKGPQSKDAMTCACTSLPRAGWASGAGLPLQGRVGPP